MSDGRIDAVIADLQELATDAEADHCLDTAWVAEVARQGLVVIVALREEFEQYKAEHHDCVMQAVDESVRVHDEIESRRDHLEADNARLRAEVEALEKRAVEAHDLVSRKGQAANHDFAGCLIDGILNLKEGLAEACKERDELQVAKDATRVQLAGLQKEIDLAWHMIENGWDIEPRDYFERESKTNGYDSALAQAVHHMWKRRLKDDAFHSRG